VTAEKMEHIISTEVDPFHLMYGEAVTRNLRPETFQYLPVGFFSLHNYNITHLHTLEQHVGGAHRLDLRANIQGGR